MAYGTIAADVITGTNGNSFSPESSVFRNRIINGAMVVNQRGGSGTNTDYTVDRWKYLGSQSSKGTWQQNAGSVTPPAGFTNYLGFTSSSAYSVLSADYFNFYQPIEGFTTADLNFGTANAKTITVSFWVRSSLTGTFGGVFNNFAGSRAYPFSYTISSANTWEYKTITIPGDTSGTWVGASNAGSAYLMFSLGAGSDRQGTAGSWTTPSTAPFTVTGATSVVGTNGATFYITGVQLEVGSQATSFDYRPYGTEFNLCARYYYRATQYGTYSPVGVGRAWSSTTGNAPFFLPVPMRGNQTITYSDLSHFDIVTIGSPTSIGNDGSGPNNVKIGWGKSSGVTSGDLYQFEFGNTTSGWLGFDAEL